MTQFRPTRFETLPPVVKNLLIINVLVFLAQNTIKTTPYGTLEDIFGLHAWQSPYFKPWQFITHMFLHLTSNWMHIIFNMLGLYIFGSVLENVWGQKRFIIFYFTCGLGAALGYMLVHYFQVQNMISQFNFIAANGNLEDLKGFIINHWDFKNGEVPISLDGAQAVIYAKINEVSFGASGALYGCLAAFAYLFPNTYLYLYFAIPIKAKWVVLIFAAIELFSAIQNSPGDNVGHVAHLGGAVVGFILVWFWNKTNRRTFY